jgi:hypothetical protein
MGWQDGRTIEVAPTVTGAAQAEALAEACRVARELGDVTRFNRYSESLEHALRFLLTLQYTTERTGHFADWYRPRIVGAFHHSHQDGNLRIDYTHHAVVALYGYLEQATK